MTDLADANLVIATVQPSDALNARALEHLQHSGRLAIPLSVGIEILLGAHTRGTPCVETVLVCDQWFDVEDKDVLLAAARALDAGDVDHAFDAVHLATAALRGSKLHTADRALLRTAFPTVAF